MESAQLFADQLLLLGYKPQVVGDWVEFDYAVPGGKYAGAAVRMAIRVPPDFPTIAPGGIDFTPRFPDRPINTGAEHPLRSHPSRHFQDAGEYWSRPHTAWNTEPQKNASAYMAWVNTLWLTT